MKCIYVEWMNGTIKYMNINDESLYTVHDFKPELCLFISETKDIIDIIIHVNDCKLSSIKNNSDNEYLVWNNNTDLKVAIHSSNKYPINWEARALGGRFGIKGIYI